MFRIISRVVQLEVLTFFLLLPCYSMVGPRTDVFWFTFIAVILLALIIMGK